MPCDRRDSSRPGKVCRVLLLAGKSAIAFAGIKFCVLQLSVCLLTVLILLYLLSVAVAFVDFFLSFTRPPLAHSSSSRSHRSRHRRCPPAASSPPYRAAKRPCHSPGSDGLVKTSHSRIATRSTSDFWTSSIVIPSTSRTNSLIVITMDSPTRSFGRFSIIIRER